MHVRAKKVMKECYERNKVGDPEYASLTKSMKARLKVTVGEKYWRNTRNYLEHFWKQKQKERARAARQQPRPLPASRSAPIPSFVGGGLGAPVGHAISLKKDSKPKSSPFKKESKPKLEGRLECVVCSKAPRTHVFVPCGHMCACKTCSSRVMESRKVCPMCNQSSIMATKVIVS